MTKPATTTSKDDLSHLEEEIVDHFFELQPNYAVFLGRHEYDGKLPILEPGATDAWAHHTDSLLLRLDQLNANALAPGRRHDIILLRLLLESALFDLRDALDLDRNPMTYVGVVSLTPYMVREYAPVAERVRAMCAVLDQVPGTIDAGRRRLQASLPKPFLQLTVAMGGGLPAHFAEAEAYARAAAPELGAKVAGARPAAEAAIAEFLRRVKDEYLPKANEDFALGPERFQKLLWVREGIERPTAEILAAGRADLKRNQDRLRAIAAQQRQSSLELLETLNVDHPTATELIATAQSYVRETRAFTEEKHLASIPEPASCRVEPTPVFSRALSTASMNPPGPFEVTGDEGIYFVTPVDESWSPAKQEEWLRSMNHSVLRNVTIHEVYPGHYLQFLHFRRSAGSLSRKVYLSASFTEGWAHYAEQLAIEQGFGNGKVAAEAAQLHDALLRDCRLIASIGLHTQGWTVGQATELFRREAFFEELPAEREAIRGTFNPEYFCYTLGKLEILNVRKKFLDAKFGGSLSAFHDQLLSAGCPPIGLLDTMFGGA
jgi:uncharacterized protein (DUF885 family)